MTQPIVPIDNARFVIDTLHEASMLAHTREYGKLTDLHLAHVALYDPREAQDLWQRRAAARAKDLAPPAAPAPAPARAGRAVAYLPPEPTEDQITAADGLIPWATQHPRAAVPLLFYAHMVAGQREKRQHLEQQVAAQQTEIHALQARLAALEARPHVKYTGVWKDGTYQAGDAATHHGALWIARQETAGEPGKDFAGWQLAVKRGAAA